MARKRHELLATAAKDSLRAPSVFNTQPWAWHLDGEALELRADRDRQLRSVDPDGKLLLLSCGTALQHAVLSLAWNGYQAHVQRFVTHYDDDLLARITVGSPQVVRPLDRAMHRATWSRRTDRRPYSDRPISPATIQTLAAEATTHGVSLHRVRYDQLPMLAIAAAGAGASELSDPDYRIELMRWTNRPEWSGDGVPAETAVAQVPRRVPVREFALPPNEGLAVLPGGDVGAAYLVLYGGADGAADWLRAGEAASAVMLAAASMGLALAPMSDLVEVAHSRELLTKVLPGPGHPYLVLRVGFSEPGPSTLRPAPRRRAEEAITGLIDGG